MSGIRYRVEEFIWCVIDAFGSILCRLGRHRWSSWISYYAVCERCFIRQHEQDA